MDSGSDADDIYGDDAESQASYEFIDDDDEEDDPVVVDAGGPDSLGRPPELQTWQSALHESLSAAPSSSGAPGAGERKAARDYRTRVVALERKAATRAAMLVLRGESAACSSATRLPPGSAGRAPEVDERLAGLWELPPRCTAGSVFGGVSSGAAGAGSRRAAHMSPNRACCCALLP